MSSCYYGQRIDDVDARRLGLTARCDNCGIECDSQDMRGGRCLDCPDEEESNDE